MDGGDSTSKPSQWGMQVSAYAFWEDTNVSFLAAPSREGKFSELIPKGGYHWG